MPYDTLKDLATISLIGVTPSVLVVNPAVPAKSVKELIALMKAKPGQLNYGAGVGGTLHLAMALFEDMAGVKAKQDTVFCYALNVRVCRRDILSRASKHGTGKWYEEHRKAVCGNRGKQGFCEAKTRKTACTV